MKQLTSIRLDEKSKKKAEKLAKLLHYDKSAVMRNALELGLERFSQEAALKLYSEGKLSLSEAALITDLSVGEFMELLIRRGIRQEMPAELTEESLKNAKKLVK